MRDATWDCRVVRRLAVVALMVTVGSPTPSSAAGGKTYPIKLDRPVKVGQQFAVTARIEATQSTNMVACGQAMPPHGSKYTAELIGTEKVESVGKVSGSPTKLTVTIDKLTKDGAEVLPAGTVVVADHTEEKKSFTVDGVDVDPLVAALLSNLIDITRGDRDQSADATLGTAKPQPVGGTWAGDPAKIVDALADEMPASSEHTRARSTLLAVKSVDGQRAEMIGSTIEADPLMSGKVIRWLTTTGGKFTSTVTRALPVEVASLPYITLDDHMTRKIEGTAGVSDVTGSITIDRTIHRTMAEKK